MPKCKHIDISYHHFIGKSLLTISIYIDNKANIKANSERDNYKESRHFIFKFALTFIFITFAQFLIAMLSNIPNWTSINPIELLSLLHQKAYPKHPTEVIDESIIEYFNFLHSQKKKKLFSITIGDKFSLLASFAEIFAMDPISLLLKWGLVIFDDCICLNLERICQIMHLSRHRLTESLKKAQYFELISLPPDCYQSLFQLGFIDSPDFSIFTISQADPFYIYIRCHPFIIQPFPVEVADIMLLAKKELIDCENEKLRLHFQSAEKRLELQSNFLAKDRNSTSSHYLSDDHHSDGEEEEEFAETA